MASSELEAERDRLVQVLDQISELAASPIALEDLLQALVESVMRLTRAGGCVLEIADGDELVYRTAAGSIAPFVGLRIPAATSLSGACVVHREVMYSPDAFDDPRVNLEAARKVAARSMLAVPLLYGRQPLGVLKSVSAEPAAFDRIDELALVSAARFIAGLLMRRVEADDVARLPAVA